ncbi:DUF4058 family protein [Tautonia marina]|uniref:DUF4058 family protein n=1 Tax=Tautonia marina TaxID=2653855 RepID=UPI0012608C6C|nr:DUF4058 family protein [Tautonia marina]
MPLHDWNRVENWDGVHLLWIAELLRWIKPRLPEGYRAYVGTSPRMSIGAPTSKADVSIRAWPRAAHPGDRPSEEVGTLPEGLRPDIEVIVDTIESDAALFVEHGGWLVAVIERVSPRNKDRPSSREIYLTRYLAYLHDGVNLLLIDVLPHPYGFSFADTIAAEIGLEQPPTPTPFAVSYRVGEPVPGEGRFFAAWRRPMTVGQPLPTITLPLTVNEAVAVDLEATYASAASDAYLD